MVEKGKGFQIFANVLLALLSICAVAPFILLIMSSFTDEQVLISNGYSFFPAKFSPYAYEYLLTDSPSVIRGYGISFRITAVGTVCNLLLTPLYAYPLSRRDFKARKFITFLFTFTMLFSGGLIPTFLVVRNLGLMNTVWALILPGAISSWNMFIMKNYFQTSIPGELYEAARIDGADNMKILFQLVLPLSMPILAVMVLYYGVAHWNSYFSALVYIRDTDRYPLQLVMRNFFSGQDYVEQGAGGDDATQMLLLNETMKYALLVIASVPMLILYPLLQRFFVKGVMLGAIKG